MKATNEFHPMPTRQIRGEWNVANTITTVPASSSDADSQLRIRRLAEREWLEYRFPDRYPSENDTPLRIEVNTQGSEPRSRERRGHG